MASDNTATVLPFTGSQKIQAPSVVSPEPFTSVVLQGAFISAANREEFLQAITMHGVTFLRYADTPLPEPSIGDLSAVEKIARALSRMWVRPSVAGGTND